MKKSRLLALTLVVALLLMGVGYAFWSETLTIDATVDTGKLDFEFVDDGFKGGKYVTGSATSNGHTLDLEFENMHPGAFGKVKFRIENTGTIGLIVEDFDFEFAENQDFSEEHLLVLVNGNLDDEDECELKGAKEYFETFGDNCNWGDVINPGKKSKPVEITFVIAPCVDEDDFPEEGDFTFSINAKVKQYNDDGRCDEDDSDEPGDIPTTPCKWWWPDWLRWPKNWFKWGWGCGGY